MTEKKRSEIAVPGGRIARLASLGSLASGVAGAMVAEGMRQLAQGKRPAVKDLLLTPANAQRVTERLSELRGAAMKVGQLLSMDAGDMLPPELTQILARLQSDARAMPRNQLVQVLDANWGAGWQRRFSEFSFTPFAAASIGQVHAATTLDGRSLAVKVQYPGVRESIASDVDNIGTLLRVAGLVPRSVDMPPLLAHAKEQLQAEADYLKERDHLIRFRQLLGDEAEFQLPEVYPALTTADVLAMSFVSGQPLETLRLARQGERDRVMTLLFALLFREIFEFMYAQSDPNFSNYLYDPASRRIVLLDFGAARDFDPQRIAAYRRMMSACIRNDVARVDAAAEEIGYFPPAVNPRHRRLVVDILLEAAAPLRHSGPYPCGQAGAGEGMGTGSRELSGDRSFFHAAPADIVFLHRKLGGLYLLASRLKARVDFGKLFEPYALPPSA